jgi:RNA polymerase sigma-70 factor (ECF subfamily)
MSEQELVRRAAAGDEAALRRLLLAHHDQLAATIARQLPLDLQPTVSADDVLQEAYLVAFRKIREFELGASGGFQAWLTSIAEHRLSDLIKWRRRAKRGGGWKPAELRPANDESTVIDMLQVLAADSRTPSREACLHEAMAAMQTALENLKEDAREALRLRYLEGLPVAEVAERIGRSEGAVHMLCTRGLQSLREELGDLSRFLSRLP